MVWRVIFPTVLELAAGFVCGVMWHSWWLGREKRRWKRNRSTKDLLSPLGRKTIEAWQKKADRDKAQGSFFDVLSRQPPGTVRFRSWWVKRGESDEHRQDARGTTIGPKERERLRKIGTKDAGWIPGGMRGNLSKHGRKEHASDRSVESDESEKE